jgi:hypothetical protein
VRETERERPTVFLERKRGETEREKEQGFLRERSEEKQTETLEIRGEKRKGRETERRDNFLKEKGKPSKEAEERKGSDREKIYTREEEQPQLPLCFLSTATAHHLTATDTAISNRH